MAQRAEGTTASSKEIHPFAPSSRFPKPPYLQEWLDMVSE